MVAAFVRTSCQAARWPSHGGTGKTARPETWHPDVLPPHATIVKEVQDTPETLAELQRHYGPSYENLLY